MFSEFNLNTHILNDLEINTSFLYDVITKRNIQILNSNWLLFV
jgi:hypothetical protein